MTVPSLQPAFAHIGRQLRDPLPEGSAPLEVRLVASAVATAGCAMVRTASAHRSPPRKKCSTPQFALLFMITLNSLLMLLCAGVTTYKGIKETETRPGHWLAISGIGGLGHLAVQYAKAMGLHVAALDVGEEKLALARSLGAELAVNATATDAAQRIVKQTGGGAHGVLVTAVSPVAFAQALQMVRRKGTVTLVGLPPGEFPTPIFDVVLKRITIRGSIVGTRNDLAEAIAFAAEGKVRAHLHRARLDEINRVLSGLRAGKVDGRIVLELA